jgi:hypothetical protein
MAISLGFGVLFATFIVLLLVPAVYLIIEDVRNITHRVMKGDSDIEPAAPNAS